MNLKSILISILCALLYFAAVYFGGKWVIEQERVSDFSHRKEQEAKAIADAKKDAEIEEWIRGIEKRRAERARILEEARQYQAESDQIIKELIEAYKRRGLWDYRCDTQVYNLYNDQP
jgi:hypothetical protein